MNKTFDTVLDWFFWFMLACSVFPIAVAVSSELQYKGFSGALYHAIMSAVLFIVIFCVIKLVPFHNVIAAVTSALIYVFMILLFDDYMNTFRLLAPTILSTILVVLMYYILKDKEKVVGKNKVHTKSLKLLIVLIPAYFTVAIFPLVVMDSPGFNLPEFLMGIFALSYFFLPAVLFMRFLPNKWLGFIILNALVLIPLFIMSANNSTGSLAGVMMVGAWCLLPVPTLLLGILYTIRQDKKFETEAEKEERCEMKDLEGIE